MKPCLNQDTLRTTPTEDFLRIAKKAEFDAVELTIDKIEQIIEKNAIGKLKKSIEDQELTVASINGPENFNLLGRDEFSNLLARTERLASAAREIGCTLLIPVPSALKSETTKEAIVSQTAMAMRELSERCGEDIRLGLEFLGMQSCSVNDLRTAVEVVRKVSKPNVGLTLDSFHMHLSESSLSGIEDLRATEIFLIHVNDSEAGDVRNLDDSKRLFPGEGVIDLRQLQTDLESLRYNGFMSLELLRPSYWQQDPIEVARKGREALRQVFGI